jgi:hypothetical protein
VHPLLFWMEKSPAKPKNLRQNSASFRFEWPKMTYLMCHFILELGFIPAWYLTQRIAREDHGQITLARPVGHGRLASLPIETWKPRGSCTSQMSQTSETMENNIH